MAKAAWNYPTAAVARDANLIVSGATNTGKTTLLNMLLATLPDHRRVGAVEDTPELQIGRFWDGNGLLVAREANTATGVVGWRKLYDHLMRITPDHILFGEISSRHSAPDPDTVTIRLHKDLGESHPDAEARDPDAWSWPSR